VRDSASRSDTVRSLLRAVQEGYYMASNVSQTPLARSGTEMSISRILWKIDEYLGLNEIPALPINAQLIAMHEQAIDVVMLRNLSTITIWLLGEKSHYLFHSCTYAGPFDVGCILASGRVVCFENKNGRPTKEDLEKFGRDVNAVDLGGILYLAHRWQHAKDNFEEYIETAGRMMAGFYCHKRCDTEKNSDDLIAKAAEKIGVSREEMLRRIEKLNVDLKDVMGRKTPKKNGHTGLYEYLREKNLVIRSDDMLPVLVAGETELSHVRGRFSEGWPFRNKKAVLVCFRFYTLKSEYPEILEMWRVDDFLI
jgi:hypothetical protein